MWDQRTKDLLKSLLDDDYVPTIPRPPPGTSVTLTVIKVVIQPPAAPAPERPNP